MNLKGAFKSLNIVFWEKWKIKFGGIAKKGQKVTTSNVPHNWMHSNSKLWKIVENLWKTEEEPNLLDDLWNKNILCSDDDGVESVTKNVRIVFRYV